MYKVVNMDSKKKEKSKFKVEIGNITPANLKQLQTINIATLPVRYTDKFYTDLLNLYSKEYLQFAFWNGYVQLAQYVQFYISLMLYINFDIDLP